MPGGDPMTPLHGMTVAIVCWIALMTVIFGTRYTCHRLRRRARERAFVRTCEVLCIHASGRTGGPR